VAYVVVSGLPGSGKTVVARPLAAALGMPLIVKDTIKEALWDALGPGDLAWSRRIGAAAAETFWRVAADAGEGVLDNFFHRAFAHRLEGLAGPIIEVHCTCPPEVARDRYSTRRRHACHFDLVNVGRFDDWVRSDAGPLDLGGPLLELDTSGPIDLDAVVAWVSAQVDPAAQPQSR
jgi:predicted kinase